MTTLRIGWNADRRALSVAALALLLCVVAGAVAADNKTQLQEFEFDIPRSSRVLALNELSRQAGGLLLGYLSSNAAEEQALVEPIKGRLTIEQALRLILRSSQLRFRWVKDDMISVEPDPLAAPVALDREAAARAAPYSGEFDPHMTEPEEVLVLGWPMRELALAGSPMVVMERDELDAVSAPTLPDLLRYISQSAYTRPESYRSSGAQYAEMRGLGPDSALVLINGRRALPSANSLSSSAFDLNTIPVTAVERIEFLLDSASAPYGTDAIGGIINIVLRDKVARPTVELRYGGAEGGAEQERISLAGGLSEDRFQGALMLDYFEMGELLGEDRDRWRNQDFRRYGGRDLRSLVSSPGNVLSLNGNLPGLEVPQVGVPAIDLTPGVSIDDFRPPAGQLNRESLLRFSSVVPEAARATVTATGKAQLGYSTFLSGELLYVDRESTYHFGPPALVGPVAPASPGNPGSMPAATVPANAFNPFGTTVSINRLLTELPPQYQYFESDLLRWVLALHGKWGSWDWEVSALRSDEQATTWIENTIDMQATARALANSDPALALNPFSPGPLGSPEVLASLRAARDVDQFSSGGQQFAGVLKGSLWSLPAGPLTAVFGGEWRNEAMRALNEADGSFDRDRNVVAGYAQLRVPLLGSLGQTDGWGMHELTLTAGARWDDYSDFGDDLRMQGALLWRPHPELSVRLSSSESFRPPSLYDLHLPRISAVGRVVDPTRGERDESGRPRGEQVTVNFISGGNSELQPATARSMTAGILYSPETAMNWRLSADWWRIDLKRRQVSVPLQVMLANEAFFAGRIERDLVTGFLQTIDASRINVGGVTTSGIDLALKADFLAGAGRLTPGLQLTWFDTYQSTDVPGQAKVERVDLASELGSIVAWRAIASLKWRRGPFGAVLFARHTPAYDDAIAGVRTDRKIGEQTLFDLQASLDFGALGKRDSRLDGLKLWLGAVNIFNEQPSYADVGDVVGFDTSQAELKERVLYLRLENKF
ncbi:MAG: TonB-dependent receptor [Pseudomonadota bacterium]|nr:TonB-dependent receptor [Pseudomonadota bacterium]